MKVKFTMSIGMRGCREETVNFDDSLFDGLNSEERDAALHELWLEWSQSYVDGGWEVVE